ncbi:MAG: histidine kinase [Saprospiraceae bacterium]
MNFPIKQSHKGEFSMYIGIPLVGILLAFVFYKGEYEFFSIEHFVSILVSIIITAINWLTCRYIVIKLWNKYPWHIKPFEHILVEVPVLVIFTVVMMFFSELVYEKTTNEKLSTMEFLNDTTIVLILVFGLVMYHEAMFFYYQWKENFNKSTLLEKTKIKAEFDLLKSQINPHFLFNSLNTLTTYVDDNKVAVEYIQTLSEFLRYSLEDKNMGNKTLKEEIEIVEKYIKLQKYRYENSLQLKINIAEEMYSKTLPALAVLTLVENAVKHNVISNSKPLTIDILTEDNKYIVIENNLQIRQNVNSTHQGLKNLINRYSFISEKEIIISETNDKFVVKLPLEE